MKLSLMTKEPITDSYGPFNTPLVIGRAQEADIHVTDIWASRRHCELDDQDGHLVLRDLNSRHGTLVNGRPVERSAELSPGDEIAIGLTKFTVHWKR